VLDEHHFVMSPVSQDKPDRLEQSYPGIRETIRHLEADVLPVCARCGSVKTAAVHCGIIGRTINLAASTTKFKLIANGPKPGKYFCNACQAFFD
jgi:hypothetical protein